ncbi:MAG: hypothetical protein K2J11_05205 [Oscillospiraceae bacterium]|nr:hypothetical protein [Oscillospiraceae bacterium]
MKKKKILGAVAAVLALTAALSACSEVTAENENAEAVTSAETTASAAETTETVSEADTEQVTEDTEETAEEEAPQAASEEERFVQISPDNEFIDYKFIENYQGTSDIGDLADKAVEFLKESEYYADSMENADKFKGESLKEFKPTSDNAEKLAEEFAYYFDSDGNIQPKLHIAYPEDYDGDGNAETFVVVDMPIMQGEYPIVRSFLIFADSTNSKENMTLLSDASYLFDTLMLDYGDFKQITFGGSGTCGADERNDLYGVVNGKAKHLYGMRGEFFKKDCFLSAFGAQGGGAFMYYDTAACEYRAIAGEDIPIEKIKEMDTTNALSEFYEWLDEHGQLYAELIGGRYYVIIRGAMDTGTAYLYENGEFVWTEDCKYVRDSHYGNINAVVDIDINKAIAEMKSVK